MSASAILATCKKEWLAAMDIERMWHFFFGKPGSNPRLCPRCDGSGMIVILSDWFGGCPECNGTGCRAADLLSHMTSNALNFREANLPLPEPPEEMCDCGHPQSDHNDDLHCSTCKCRGFDVTG